MSCPKKRLQELECNPYARQLGKRVTRVGTFGVDGRQGRRRLVRSHMMVCDNNVQTQFSPLLHLGDPTDAAVDGHYQANPLLSQAL